MSFVGVIANDRDAKVIRKMFAKKNISKTISVLEINENNIENGRNISFETLIFCKDLNCTSKQNVMLNQICENASYLVINRDFVFHTLPTENNTCTTITFGLNQQSSVTVSSISESGFVLSLQQNVSTLNDKIYEMEEKCIKTKNTNNFTLYKLLLDYIIKIIYQ